jgi:hypothetical protein
MVSVTNLLLTEVYHKDAAKDLCKETPEVADSSEINEEGATVPTMNNFGLRFLSSPVTTCVL